MDPDLQRLCAIPGHDDLSYDQVAHVMQVHQTTVARLVVGQKLESKRHHGRGTGKQSRVRISRAAVVRYLVRQSTADRAVIIAAIKEQCPQYLPAIADLVSGSAELPKNVIPMDGQPRQHRHKADEWHPGQLALFQEFPAAS